MNTYFLYYDFPDGTRSYMFLDGRELTYEGAMAVIGVLIKHVQEKFWKDGFDAKPTDIYAAVKASIPAYGILHRALGKEVQHDDSPGSTQT